MKISFCFEAVEFQCDFIMRPLKVQKLVRANQFQVKSTKMGIGRKFVTLQYTRPSCFRLHHESRHASRQSKQTLPTLTHQLGCETQACIAKHSNSCLRDRDCHRVCVCVSQWKKGARRMASTTSDTGDISSKQQQAQRKENYKRKRPVSSVDHCHP